ncbi:ATP synthase F1 subunit gamma [Candidatus Saccharibacteria bacterium]|nr:ATP synthase F1 subunit gamma [Candidatus Saccharibacteria bacterium]
MASTQQLRQRITSVKNTKQITKAMEMVAASKLRRAQDSATASREFAKIANQLLTRIRQLTDVNMHPLFTRRTVKKKLIILVSSDRGLAGGYNANVFKEFTAQLQKDKVANTDTKVITVGKKATAFTAKVSGLEVLGAYHDFVDNPTAEDLRPILITAIDGFKNGEFDAVDIVYTDFISSINQKPSTAHLLPVAFDDVEIPSHLQEADFEPTPTEVLDQVTERFVEVTMMQYMLESAASEHSARMMAMKNATDNANDITEDLTLALNTARQAAITQELAEITGGAEAIA